MVSLRFHPLRREKVEGTFLLPFLAVRAGAKTILLSIFLRIQVRACSYLEVKHDYKPEHRNPFCLSGTGRNYDVGFDERSP
jgi:hypothetical protein